MNLRPRRMEEPEISLVACIDVVLMLVIFFMLSSTFATEGRLRVHLPEASATPVQRSGAEPLVVTITERGEYRVNERSLVNSGRETLRAAIAKVAGEGRRTRVTVRADGRATHQSVVTAMDVLGRMGFAELNVATVNDTPTP